MSIASRPQIAPDGKRKTASSADAMGHKTKTRAHRPAIRAIAQTASTSVQGAAVTNLAEMPLLSMAAPDGKKIWRLNSLSGQEAEVVIMPRLATDDLLTLKEAALDGLGVALIPAHLVRLSHSGA